MSLQQLSSRNPKLHKDFLKYFIQKNLLNIREIRQLSPEFVKENDFLFSIKPKDRNHRVYLGSIDGLIFIAAFPYGKMEFEHVLKNVIKTTFESLSGKVTYEKYTELIYDMKFKNIEELLIEMLEKEVKKNDEDL